MLSQYIQAVACLEGQGHRSIFRPPFHFLSAHNKIHIGEKSSLLNLTQMLKLHFFFTPFFFSKEAKIIQLDISK